MKEIGGYIELEYMSGREYHNDLMRLNIGRSCITHLIKQRGYKKILLPDFLCGCIEDTCNECGIEIQKYSVGLDLRPSITNKTKPDEALFIINYYGQLSHKDILAMRTEYGNLIVDNTQAFFQQPLPGVDTFYTCRKYFGVPDGAYLSADGLDAQNLTMDSSRGRVEHLLGRLETDASSYYDYFLAIEKELSGLSVMQMSPLTRNMLKGIDYQAIIERRKNNFEFLHEKLKSRNMLKLSVPIGPFMYPLFVENGARLKKSLIAEKIYVPTLWPNVLSDMPVDSTEYRLAEDIVPLPVDQRYSLRDMENMVKVIYTMVGAE